MKQRLITTGIFTLLVIMLYQFVDFNGFTIDFSRRLSNSLFRTMRDTPDLDTQVVILDIGNAPLDSVKAYLEILASLEPRAIGLNLCSRKEKSEILDRYLHENSFIITCDCNPNSDLGSSKITSTKKEVTHFRTDKNSYFETQLSENSDVLTSRRNKTERISFREHGKYYQASLNEIKDLPTEIITDQTILIGSMRENLVTPMNPRYGRPGQPKGDMSETQISASIISTINRNEFINEIGLFYHILTTLTAALICAALIRLFRTKYTTINIFLGLVVMVFINGLVSFLVMLAFTENYYLELPEITLVIIISTIVSIFWNTKEANVINPV